MTSPDSHTVQLTDDLWEAHERNDCLTFLRRASTSLKHQGTEAERLKRTEAVKWRQRNGFCFYVFWDVFVLTLWKLVTIGIHCNWHESRLSTGSVLHEEAHYKLCLTSLREVSVSYWRDRFVWGTHFQISRLLFFCSIIARSVKSKQFVEICEMITKRRWEGWPLKMSVIW